MARGNRSPIITSVLGFSGSPDVLTPYRREKVKKEISFLCVLRGSTEETNKAMNYEWFVLANKVVHLKDAFAFTRMINFIKTSFGC